MRSLTVQGKGRVLTEPDIIFISFKVETASLRYDTAVSELNQRTAKLKQSFVENNIPECELKTTDFGIEVRHRRENSRYVFDGYDASHSLRIQVPNEKAKLNALLRSISASESGAEIRINFSVKDTSGIKKKALEKAVAEAKRNAAVLTEAAGVQLGDIMNIDYGWEEVHIYDHHNGMAYVCAENCAAEVDIEPEGVQAEVTVTIVYAIT